MAAWAQKRKEEKTIRAGLEVMLYDGEVLNHSERKIPRGVVSLAPIVGKRRRKGGGGGDQWAVAWERGTIPGFHEGGRRVF